MFFLHLPNLHLRNPRPRFAYSVRFPTVRNSYVCESLCLSLFFPIHRTPTPQETVRTHIRLLHDYNELRDIGTGLMSLIADQRGVRLKEIMAEFGVGEGD